MKKVCSKCRKILQEITNVGTKEEKIDSFEPLWYQVDLLYICCECYMGEKSEEKS